MKHVKFKTQRLNTHSRKYDSIPLMNYPDDTIPLWVADMDIEVDERILNGLHDYLNEKVLGYNLEHESYRLSIKDYLWRRHQLNIETDWIITTPNVVSSINASLLSLTQPNDHVLILEPVYMPFFKSVEATQRRVVFSSLKPTPVGYVMDFDDIELKCHTYDIKMVILCSPHNPVGRVWTHDELQRFIKIMTRHNIIILSDEIHMDFIFKGHKHVPLMSLHDKTIMLMSASKTFNLASAHVSQIVVKDPHIRRKILSQYHQLGLFQLVEFGLRATTIAYQSCDDYIDELCNVIESHVELIKHELEDTNMIITPMEGTYLVWIDARAYQCDTTILQKRLIHEAKVWLHDGSIFGPTGQGYLRLNCATSPQLLVEACRRIKQWIKENGL